MDVDLMVILLSVSIIRMWMVVDLNVEHVKMDDCYLLMSMVRMWMDID